MHVYKNEENLPFSDLRGVTPFSLGISTSPGEVTPGILAMFAGGVLARGEFLHCIKKSLW